MLVADHSGDLPAVRFVLPNVHESRFSDHSVVLRPRVKKAMDTDLYRSVVFQRINFH